MQVNLLEYITKTAKIIPDKAAVVSKERTLSFEELVKESFRLSNEILKYNISNQPIALAMQKGTEQVVAILATLMSGNIYCPLDINSPHERINKIITSLGTGILITDTFGKKVIDNSSFTNVSGVIEAEKLRDEPVDDLSDIFAILEKRLSGLVDSDPCYIIFTSGSTGTPKGVTISHRSVIDYIDWANSVYSVSESDIIGSQAPFYFDNSTLDLYLCFSTGATLNIIPEATFIFPQKLLEYLVEKSITTIFWVPSILVTIANLKLLENTALPKLRNVLFAGEVMPAKHIKHWLKYHPKAHYSNLYGPTEITVDCTYYDVPNDWDGDSLPIGIACRNSGVLILNGNNEEADKGELCVKGSSLALGYWNDKAKTDEVFCQTPLHENYEDKIYRTGDIVTRVNGLIYYLGRKDFQIKHNGYRIELGEIESTVSSLELVDSCVAGYILEEKILYVAVVYNGAVTQMEFRKVMSTRLPKYMTPNKVVFVDEIPLTPNGKFDRLALTKLIGSNT